MNEAPITCEAEDPVNVLRRAEKLRDDFGLLTPADLAALIGVDARTLACWRAQSAGPDFTRLGRSVFYRRVDIESWIDLNVMPSDRTIR
jgi:hypothetical protein